MCGHCGWITQSTIKLSEKKRLQRARVLEGLMVANAARGTDATGLAMVRSNDERDTFKMAIPSMRFVEKRETRDLMRLKDGAIAIGHTRFATTGANIHENAHPFTSGNVIGAHNGVISNYISLDDVLREDLGADVKDYRHAQVDSEVVFRLLNSVEPKYYLTALERVRGSAALVWHDKRNPTGVWMVAHENPLNAAWVPSLQTMFWSSQYDHLSSILWGVFGEGWEPVKIKDDTLYLFKTDDVLKGVQDWPAKFKTYASYSTSAYDSYVGHGGVAVSRATWSEEDEDYDGKVVHPFEVAQVFRTPTPAVVIRASGSSEIPTGTLDVLERMGLPYDPSVTVDAHALDTPVSTSEDFDEDGDWSWLGDSCHICTGVLDADSLYFKTTDAWVCIRCVEEWDGQGMTPDTMEAMIGNA